MRKTLVILGIVAMVVLMLALSVGTALAQGPNPDRKGTCTPTCTPQAGAQLQTRTQLRIMTCTPQPAGSQVRTGR